MRILAALFFATHFAADCSTVKLDGFVNIAISSSSSNTAKVRQLISQPRGVFDHDIAFYNSSLGLQFEWLASPNWQFVSQALLKDQDTYSFDSLTQLAFVRFTPNANWTLRAGRTGLDLFMMTEYRDIGYSFTHGHLPTEFYAIVPHQNIDGLDLRYKTPSAFGLVSLRGFFGHSTAPIISDDNFSWDAELKNIAGITIELENNNWLFRGNHTQSQSGNENDQQQQLREAISLVPPAVWPNQPQLTQSLNIIGKRFYYTAIGLRYDGAQWLAQSELSYINSNSEVLDQMRSGYFSIGRRFGEHTFMATTSIAKSSNKTPDKPIVSTPELNFLYDNIIRHTNFYLIDQHTLALTWRVELNEISALKIHLDHTRVKQLPSAFYLHKKTSTPDNQFNTLGISLNWVF